MKREYPDFEERIEWYKDNPDIILMILSDSGAIYFHKQFNEDIEMLKKMLRQKLRQNKINRILE